MILKLFHTLFEIYGEQHWWPCKSGSRWEIVTGAILVQNTAWGNVEKALANLEAADLMSPERIHAFPEEELRETIRPAGFFHQKAAYLKAAAEFYLLHEREYLKSNRIPDLRKRLLEYTEKYPECCRLTDIDEKGGMRFEVRKGRLSFRLTAPYSEERRSKASEYAKKHGLKGGGKTQKQ